MRYLSVCSGMEAATVAWHPLGWKPVGFSEIEPFPCAILKHRFPDTPNYGSLTDYAQWPIERGAADLLVGGTPCQSFSVAGLRKGLEDPRGNLALVFLGLADRIKPRWIVWENVPGVLSSNGGRDFGSFLGALVQLGYGFAYRVLDAQHFGVPQRRRRVFVVACLGDWRAPAEVLLESDCVRRDPKKGRAKGQGAAAGAEGGIGADNTVSTLCARDFKGADNIYVEEGKAVLHPCPDHDSVGTLCARDFKGVGNQFVQEGKCIPCKPIVSPTVTTCKGSRGGSSSEAIDEITAIHLAQQQAQSAAIPFRKSKRAQSDKDDETWVPADASNTLNNFDLGDTRTTHAVVGPIAIQGTIIGRGENASPQGTGATEGGPMFTLTKTDIHGVAHSIPIQDGREIDKKQNGIGIGQPGDPAYTIDTTGAQSVAHCSDVAPFVTQADVAGTLDAHYYKGPGSRQGGEREYVAHPPAMAVRRLTPVECERLQGFPDNWSRIPWKGKPEEDCPDGPRYKACGNSMAVPVMRWIGERIAQADQTFFPR